MQVRNNNASLLLVLYAHVVFDPSGIKSVCTRCSLSRKPGVYKAHHIHVTILAEHPQKHVHTRTGVGVFVLFFVSRVTRMRCPGKRRRGVFTVVMGRGDKMRLSLRRDLRGRIDLRRVDDRGLCGNMDAPSQM